MHDPQADVWKGAAAGLAAGLAATWVMTRFQELSGKLAEPSKREHASAALRETGQEGERRAEGAGGRRHGEGRRQALPRASSTTR